MKKRAIGIDLGTTNCCIAWAEGGQEVVYQDEQGRSTIPSVVAQTRDGEILVGWRAKNCENPLYRHGFFKRALGSTQTFPFSDGPVGAVQVSALLLKELKQRAEAKLGCEVAAVVTVPAHFLQLHRDETRQAAQEAGLELIDLLQEPIAAAIAYNREETARNGELPPEETILVYDLGGGTMDATVCVRRGAHIEIGAFGLAYEGDKFLGGIDFDKALVGMAAAQLNGQGFKSGTLGADLPSAQWLWELLTSAERCKQRLGDEEEVQWTKELVSHNPERRATLNLWVTRREFEESIRHLLVRTLECCDQALIAHARRLVSPGQAKNKSELLKLATEKLDRIILVGGSTLMPAVRRYVREHYQDVCGRAPEVRGFRPYECVAIGAAIYAAARGSQPEGSPDQLVQWVSGPVDKGQEVSVHPSLSGVVAACDGAGWQIEIKVGARTERAEIPPGGHFRLPPFDLAPGENRLELTVFNSQGQVHGRQTLTVKRGGISVRDPGLARPISVRLVDCMFELVAAGTPSGASAVAAPLYTNDNSEKAVAPLYEGHYPIGKIEFSADAQPGVPVIFRTLYRPGKLEVEVQVAACPPQRHEVRIQSFSYTQEQKVLRQRFDELLGHTQMLLNDLPEDGQLGQHLRREWQALKMDIETEFANQIVLDLNRIEDRVCQLELLRMQVLAYSSTAEGLRQRVNETRKMIEGEPELIDVLEQIEAEINDDAKPEELAASAARLRELRRTFYLRHPPEIDEKLIEFTLRQLRLSLDAIRRDAEGDGSVLQEARELDEEITQMVNSGATSRAVFNRLARLEQEHVNELYQQVVIRKSQRGLLRSTR